MPQEPLGIAKLRDELPGTGGPPNAPLASRVSTTRHGVTGTNCSGVLTDVPDNPMLCGEPAPLSTIVTVAVLTPAAAGVNAIDSEQEFETASVFPQFVVMLKSAEFCPDKLMPEMARPADPVLL
jgi:hypothetical protein